MPVKPPQTLEYIFDSKGDFMDSYRLVPIVRTGLRIRPRQRVSLYNKTARGYLFMAIFRTNNPDVRVLLDVYAEGRIEINVSIRELVEEYGFTYYIPGAFVVTMFDPNWNVGSNYVSVFSLQPPGLAFSGRLRLETYNPTDQDATVSLHAWYYEKKENI